MYIRFIMSEQMINIKSLQQYLKLFNSIQTNDL